MIKLVLLSPFYLPMHARSLRWLQFLLTYCKANTRTHTHTRYFYVPGQTVVLIKALKLKHNGHPVIYRLVKHACVWPDSSSHDRILLTHHISIDALLEVGCDMISLVCMRAAASLHLFGMHVPHSSCSSAKLKVVWLLIVACLFAFCQPQQINQWLNYGMQ